MANLRPIYYDTETTGVNPAHDKIIEIAAYDPLLDRTFESLVNPLSPIPQEAMAIHGITDQMVQTAPTFAEVGKKFIEFCQGNVVLLAHNNDAFDRLFLLHESKRHGIAMPHWPMIDTLKWTRKYRSDLPKHNLQFLRRVYGFAENQAHRALDDVIILYKIFSVLFDDLSMEQVLELLAENSTELLPQVMPFGKHKGKPFSELPSFYIQWLKKEGALDKEENRALKKALEKLNLV